MSTPTRTHGRLAALTLTALVAGACSNSLTETAQAPTRTIVASEFRDPNGQAPEPVEREAVAPIEQEQTAPAVALVGGPSGARAPEVRSDSQAPSDATPRGVTDRLIVDRMVGQINGNPLYASAFFENMDARLRAESQKMSVEQWVAFTRQQITQELSDRIWNELLLAEFESALSPEERQGILGFIRSLREGVLKENLGSEAVADSKLQQREGITLDQYLEREKDRAFVREQVRREIESRVKVSYRDIKQRYERDREKYEPKPIAIFRVIRVPASDETARDAVEAALLDGTPGVEIAKRYGRFNRENDGLLEVTLESGDVAGTQIFAIPELNDPSQSLGVGQTTDAIEYRSSVQWVHLEEIRTPETKSLYDVQLQIENEIRNERTFDERKRYAFEIFSRGSFTDIKAMEAELLRFAAERYLIVPKVTGPGGDKGEG